MIQLRHHGAVQGVTGSCHELVVGERSILVDCGLFQGAETAGRAGANALNIDFPISQVRALIVTHTHIDHVGRIPYLLSAGFDGPILCSEPTAMLLPAVLEDALEIGFTRDRALIDRSLARIEKRLVRLAYGQWQTLWDEPQSQLRVRLQRAGHILGSAYVECDARVGGQRERIVFSGDLGAPNAPLLPPPKSPYGCDRLVIESTYGDRVHEDRRTRKQRLQQAIEHAMRDGGTLLIPAFSIGRTQELLYELEELMFTMKSAAQKRQQVWNDLPVIVDSPLAATFNRLYEKLRPYWNREARERLNAGRHPLSFAGLLTVNTHDDHLRVVHHLADSGRPAIVIAGSGMCTGGRVVNYLKALLDDARNDVLFVGYQATGTLGRQILERAAKQQEVVIDGERIPVRAQVSKIGGYSAHADQQDLLNFVRRMTRKPSEIRIVHGDDEAKRVLAMKMQGVCPEANVVVPGIDIPSDGKA